MPKRYELARRPAAGRRAFLRGAAIAGAATLVQVATGGGAAHAATPVLAGDGVTDDAPALQQIFDAGLQPAFVSNRTYLLNSPIFLDRPTSVTMFVMELNGAILKLGPNLPTTDAFYRDTATRWALFPNTKRTALSGGKVNVSVETRATGEGTGALISLVLRNGTVDGNKANVGFAFGNRTGAKFESVILRRGRTLLSWYDYSDANVFLQCHNKAGGPATSVLVEQVSSGDGLLMQSCKADSAVGLARLKYCRGAEIVGTVTGRIELDACSAIQIRGGHQETPIANQTIIDIRSSDVVIDTTALYLARGNADESLPPAIRITDSGSPASSVVLRDCVEMRALVASDERLGNLISIEEAVAGTRVETRGLNAVVSVRGVGGVWSKSIGPSIGGAAPIAAAVARSLATVATGDFKLNNPGGGWVVSSTSAISTYGAMAPTVTGVKTVGKMSGSLRSRGYRYLCQGKLSNGRLTPASSYSPSTVPANGALRFTVAANGGAQELRIWRFSAGSTTPDGYVAVPAAAVTHTLYDTGESLSGFAWLAGNTVAPPS